MENWEGTAPRENIRGRVRNNENTKSALGKEKGQ
jgi:hypothetical protein